MDSNNLTFFPPALIELNKEVAENHPKVMELIAVFTAANGRHPDVKESIAIVAGYVGLVLDSHYVVDILCDLLVKELKVKRMIVITSRSN